MHNPFRYFNSSPEVIRSAVMLYVRFPLSLRQVEDLLNERGIDVSYETIRYWWNRFGPLFAAEIRNRRIRHGSGIIGLLVRRLAEDFARRAEPAARRVSAVLFVLVLARAIYQERGNIVTYFAQAGLVTLVLNLLMMVIAYLLARTFATGPSQRIAISIECGLQNGTLAIAVAVLLFGGGLATVPAATYSLIMFATALVYVALLRRG